MNLTTSIERRAAIVARLEKSEAEPISASVCRCGKPLKHAGPCPGFKRGPRKAKPATAQPAAVETPVSLPLVQPSTALVAQPACAWAIKFEEGDDRIDMAGRGRDRFETVVKTLHALIS